MNGKKNYPDLQNICRLCLKENEGTICIFPKEKSSDKFSTLSIPMRIMTCASLEVQDSDELPKKICSDCRLQLEKSYYFRKMSQASDSKLKKHSRLVSLGRVSTVFSNDLDDDDGIEIEFKDSLDFIQEEEEKKKQEEKRKFEEKINDIRIQHERELETTKEELRRNYEEHVIPLMKEQIKKDLKLEIRNEMEENLRQAIMDQCLIEARDLVRNEVREECRQSEIKSLLDDLQTYLTNKKCSLEQNPIKISDVRTMGKKQQQATGITPKLEYVEMGLQTQVEEDVININDEECESDGHFLAYDTDEGFELQKNMPDNREDENANEDANEIEYDEDEMENNASYTKLNDSDILDNNEESQETTTTSYRIDNENGEIQFLKKADNVTNELDEDNLDQNYENIMIIKLPDNTDGDFIELDEEKCSKSKTQSSKPKKSQEKNSKLNVSVSRTKTRVEATTVVTKTYVNPMQRSTDTPKIFKCNDCPMVFSTKPSLERHLRTHEKVEKMGVTFQCPECHIVVSCNSALRRHMYIHCEEKPFSCNLCDKSFVQREILKRHMQTHTGVKPHQCNYCDRAFAQRINLTQHINRNHLETPRVRLHSCHLCPKRFNHASGLSRHLGTHSGVTFQCNECNRTFGDRSSIKRHIANTHTNSKPSKKQ